MNDIDNFMNEIIKFIDQMYFIMNKKLANNEKNISYNLKDHKKD